jgi:hypothetical protein
MRTLGILKRNGNKCTGKRQRNQPLLDRLLFVPHAYLVLREHGVCPRGKDKQERDSFSNIHDGDSSTAFITNKLRSL